jgi:hypothetical protein
MNRNRVAFAALLVSGLIAAGCGSDDDADADKEPASDGKPAAAEQQSSKPPAKQSHRAKMVQCIKDELGFDVDSDDDTLSVKNPDGKLQAVIVIHSNAGDARRSVNETLAAKDGYNTVAFGRAQFILRGAGDTEAGTIANCVSIEYNSPGG